MSRRRGFAFSAATAAAVIALAAPVGAAASDIVDRNATDVRLKVSRDGLALVTYRARGRLRRVLVWGAINARHPTPDVPQVRFRMDYSGGWASRRREVWRTLRNACGKYTGPPLAWLVTACTAPDGSHWALQAWQRLLPHRGVEPWLESQRVFELRMSHWSGPTAVLEGWTDWIYGGQAHDLFGRFTYAGRPVHGFRTRPLDTYARNLYIDTFDSRYGAGWKRETSIVARRPNGNYCYSFWPTNDHALPGAPWRPAGNGSRYRITAIGPGVTPDVMWEGRGLSDFDAANRSHVEHERRMNELVDRLAAGDSLCLAH